MAMPKNTLSTQGTPAVCLLVLQHYDFYNSFIWKESVVENIWIDAETASETKNLRNLLQNRT